MQQRDMAGVVNGLAAAARASVDRFVSDRELALGPGAAPRDVPYGSLLPCRRSLRFDRWDAQSRFAFVLS